MGCVMAYGAYLPQETSIPATALAVVCADTSIALLSGLVIFPIVFANGLDPMAGPDLIFRALPLSFGNMPDRLEKRMRSSSSPASRASPDMAIASADC